MSIEKKEHFYDEIRHNIKDFETKRRSIIYPMSFCFCIFSSVVIFILFKHFEFLNKQVDIILASIIFIFTGGAIFTVGVYIWYVIYRNLFKQNIIDFKRNLKDFLINGIINYLGYNLSYKQNEYVPKSIFRTSKIYNNRAEDYKGDDYIEGSIGENINITMSEVCARVEDVRDEFSFISQKFKGIFISVNFYKYFTSFTQIVSKRRSIYFQDKYKVILEDLDFNKRFSVYSNDQIDARYILSPSLIEKINDYCLKSKHELNFSFENNTMFITIGKRNKFFEPSLLQSLNRTKTLDEYYDNLNFIFDIAYELNSNVNIWCNEEKPIKRDELIFHSKRNMLNLKTFLSAKFFLYLVGGVCFIAVSLINILAYFPIIKDDQKVQIFSILWGIAFWFTIGVYTIVSILKVLINIIRRFRK